MAIRTNRYALKSSTYSKNGEAGIYSASEPESGSLIHLTDTHRNGFEHWIGVWINSINDAWRVGFVCHSGDVLNDSSPVPSDTFEMFGGNNFILALGNHDFTAENKFQDDVEYNIGSMPWVTPLVEGAWEKGSYCSGYIGGKQWLFVALPWFATNAEVDLAAAVIDAQTLPVIISFHGYLYRDKTRYDYQTYGDSQAYSPHTYPGFTGVDGGELWRRLIEARPLIKIVLSGHDYSGEGFTAGVNAVSARVHLMSTRADGSQCLQICSGAQDVSTSRIRSMYFNYKIGKIIMRTWSVNYASFLLVGDDNIDLDMPK